MENMGDGIFSSGDVGLLFVAILLKTGQMMHFAQISNLLRESQQCNSTLQHLLGHYAIQCEAQDDGSRDPGLPLHSFDVNKRANVGQCRACCHKAGYMVGGTNCHHSHDQWPGGNGCWLLGSLALQAD